MGATPACDTDTAMCVACVVDGDCPEGKTCDTASNTCVEGEQCVADAECANIPGRPVCFQGRCVECLQTSDCPARSECSGAPNWQCTSMPCTGVTCQTGTSCDEMTGRCVKADGSPGCLTDMDCANPDTMGCNAQTGQCYYDAFQIGEAACDLGGDAVCAPGSTCVVNQLFMVGACQCRIDPATMMGSGCHPGQTSIQDPLTPDETDGGCIGLGM